MDIKKYKTELEKGIYQSVDEKFYISEKIVKKVLEDYCIEQCHIADVVVPKGTLPKDIEFISKESWELFNKHYDSETFNKHTKHWVFMEGIRTAIKNKK